MATTSHKTNQAISISTKYATGREAKNVTNNEPKIARGIAPINMSENKLTNTLTLCLTASASLFQSSFGYFKFIKRPKMLNATTETIGQTKINNAYAQLNGIKHKNIMFAT